MAAEVGSGDGVRIESPDSDSSFYGFTESDIGEVDPRNSDDGGLSDFEVNDDSSLDSESDGDFDDASAGQRPVHRGRGRGAHRRGRGAGPRAGRGRGGRARGREQTVWSDNLVDPPAVRYRNAATTGVKDSDECRGMSPLALFTLFFTDYLLRDIVTETNRYAQQCLAQPPKRGDAHLPWIELTVPELRSWLGLIFAMGVVQKIGRLSDYWSTHANTSTPAFSRTMPCKRFLHILRFLHFIDNEDATVDKTVRTWKVQKVLNYLCKRFREVYTPRRELCVDETMVKFKGRLSIKQYIKIKPVKWGIKLFTLAESATGYVLNLIPYTGKRVDTDLSKTTQTVLDVAHDYMHLGHHLFMDNYYMSIELVSSLSGKDTLCCGTVNSNRVGLPADVKKTAPAVKQLARGQSLKRMRDGILAITWMDIRAVNLLTNIPNCLGDADVRRRDKKTGAEIVISRPTAIQLYNTYMGGVDLSDQRVGTYRRHMKSMTCYLQLFFHLLELSAVQAYLGHFMVLVK